MERRFYHDDFEELIKQKADQYKMYPSENVWKSVHRSIHPHRKWYWFGFALLLSGIGYYSIQELAAPPAPIPLTDKSGPVQENNTVIQPAELIPFSLSAEKDVNRTTGKRLVTQETSVEKTEQAKVIPITAIAYVPGNSAVQSSAWSGISEVLPAHAKVPSTLEMIFATSGLVGIPVKISSTQPIDIQQPDRVVSTKEEPKTPRVNWLQEYAAYQFSLLKSNKLGWQLSFSPTMNYRKLSGNRDAVIPSEVKYIPMSLSIKGDLERLVNHKPALGFELGSALFYKLNKHLSLKGGLQFNYSRYNIEAYSGSSEIATIALTNEYGYQTDSLSSLTQIRNFGGYAIKDIQNQYFQLSTPIGFEWKILGSDRFQFNIAGTIQPTYLLNRNTYLITTDYKNYTKEPSLVRRWNINTSAEAYIAYKTGGVSWQIGPQFRYQLLSSYTKEYPIKEYLMEYGLKFGVTKTIR